MVKWVLRTHKPLRISDFSFVTQSWEHIKPVKACTLTYSWWRGRVLQCINTAVFDNETVWFHRGFTPAYVTAFLHWTELFKVNLKAVRGNCSTDKQFWGLHRVFIVNQYPAFLPAIVFTSCLVEIRGNLKKSHHNIENKMFLLLFPHKLYWDPVHDNLVYVILLYVDWFHYPLYTKQQLDWNVWQHLCAQLQ